MTEENEYLKYPVQPFVFEFAKKASKYISLKDVHMRPSPPVDMGPIDAYLEENGAFLDELEGFGPGEGDSMVPDVRTLPVDPVFFQSGFNLKNMRNFREVFTPGCLKQRLFGERLVQQLDSVQSLLYNSSDSTTLHFFRSFTAIHEMNHGLSVIHPKIQGMREDLSNLNEMANAAPRIAALKRRKQRLVDLKNRLNVMKSICSAPKISLELAELGNFADAYKVLNSAKDELLSGLITVGGMKSFLDKIEEARNQLEKMIVQTIASVMIGDEQDAGSLTECLHPDDAVSYVNAAMEVVKESALKQVHSTLKDSEMRKGTNLASLPVRDFTSVLTSAFPSIRMKILVKISKGAELLSESFKIKSLPTDSIDTVSKSIADAVFKEVSSIVSSHPLNAAAIEDFGGLYEAMISFGRGCEKFGVDRALIQTSTVTFGRSFVESFHCEQSKKITLALATETWVRSTPTAEHLDIIKRLGSGATTDSLSINGEIYGCSACLLSLLEVIWCYYQAARSIRRTADDVAAKLSEAVRLFSTQSRDLVLGGGAMQSANLKSISTRNLAVSAAGLDLLINLLPYIRPRLVALGANQHTVDVLFSESAAELRSHMEKLLNKIVWVLSNQITEHCKNAEIGTTAVSEYAEKIKKEMATLNRALSDTLPSSKSTLVFMSIGTHISSQVDTLFRSRGSKFESAIARDVAYLNEQLSFCGISIKIQGLP